MKYVEIRLKYIEKVYVTDRGECRNPQKEYKVRILAWRVVPPASHGISRVPRYSGYCSLSLPFAYMTLTFFGVLSHTLRLEFDNAICSPQPQGYFYPWFGLLRVRSPLLAESRLISFPRPT